MKGFGQRRQMVLVALSAVLVATCALSGAYEALQLHVARRAAFQLRLATFGSPALDPRIKIFAWDDKTTQLLTRWNVPNAVDLPLASWARVFAWIGAAKPEAILVDKVFENPYGGVDDADAFVKAVRATGVPVVAGGYLSSEENAYVKPLPRVRPEYVARPAKGDKLERFFYGPHPRIVDAFARIGHLSNADGGAIRGLEPVDDASGVLHWSLVLSGRELPPAPEERIPVNLVKPAELNARSRSFGWLLSEMADRHTATGIGPGDVVVILPSAYTGGTDFKETLLGKMPGGYVQISMLNSALTGGWLHVVDGGFALTLLGALLGAIVASRLRPSVFWPLAGGVLVLTGGGAFLAFAALGLDVVWVPPVCAFLTTGTLFAVEASVATYLRHVALQTDVKLGEAVQSLCLPETRAGAFGEYEYHITFKPFGPMSGDWLQTHIAPEGAEDDATVLAIGDVVGKGPRAALSTAVVAAAFHRLAKNGFGSPKAALQEMDDALKTTFRGKQNTTVSLAAVRRDGVQMFACGAPHWLHAKASGVVDPVRTKPSKLLGMEMGTATFHDATVALAPGELLIAYTDGVMEGMVLRGKFQRALADALKAKPQAPFAEVQATVERLATELGRTMGVEDDFTLMVIQRRYGVPESRSVTDERVPVSVGSV